MFRQGIALPLIAALLMIGIIALTIAGAQVHAQQSGPSGPFEYVGFDGTIGRVEVSSGRIWVLQNQREDRYSIKRSPTADGWHWVPVNLSEGKPDSGE